MSTFPIPTDAMGITFLKGIRDCIAVMGEALVYQAGGAMGTPVALTGVWTEDTGVQVSRPGAQASVYLCLPEMPADPAKGDAVVHNGIKYFVMDATFDGHGSARLFLRKP